MTPTQIAPTILRLLGINPNALQAVQIEHTQALQRRLASYLSVAQRLPPPRHTRAQTEAWGGGGPGRI